MPPSQLAKPKRQGPSRLMLVAGSVAVVVTVFAAIFIANGQRDDAPRAIPGPFNPQTTDPTELRRVTEAVSRIIAAPPSQHVAAVETLEAVRAESPGARDLKDSCVNTYRGLIRAEETTAQLRAIEGAPDGGQRDPSAITPADRVRAVELHQQARDQIELVSQSRNRCMDLYANAVATMHMEPARRAPR